MPLKKVCSRLKNSMPDSRLASVVVLGWMWVRRNIVATMMATMADCSSPQSHAHVMLDRLAIAGLGLCMHEVKDAGQVEPSGSFLLPHAH